MVVNFTDKNYSYHCGSCNHSFLPCDRLADWKEEDFAYCGVAATVEGLDGGVSL